MGMSGCLHQSYDHILSMIVSKATTDTTERPYHFTGISYDEGLGGGTVNFGHTIGQKTMIVRVGEFMPKLPLQNEAFCWYDE